MNPNDLAPLVPALVPLACGVTSATRRLLRVVRRR